MQYILIFRFRVHDVQDSNDNKYINNEEGTEMTIRQHSNQRTIDTPINEGDTLQALSIRYHCSVSIINIRKTQYYTYAVLAHIYVF